MTIIAAQIVLNRGRGWLAGLCRDPVRAGRVVGGAKEVEEAEMTDNKKVSHLQEMEMVLRDSRRLKGEVENLKRDLAQRTSEYEAKVDEVIRLEKEVAALRYEVQNQTLRADDAVEAYQICLRDYEAREERLDMLSRELETRTENADFLRKMVGVCHLMISRDDMGELCRESWEETTLPPRLFKFISLKLAAQKERIGVLEGALCGLVDESVKEFGPSTYDTAMNRARAALGLEGSRK
jgi:hypothetical protein